MKRNSLLIFYISFFLTACEGFVNIDPPSNQLLTSNVYSNDESAMAALSGLYISMVDKGTTPYTMAFYHGLLADELTNYGNVSTPLYINSLRPLDSPTNSLWNSIYTNIYQANSIYEGCQQSEGISPGLKRQLIAESKFVRAFSFLYLTALWGDVPLVLSTNYKNHASTPKTNASSVLKQVILDLQDAEQNLQTDYVSGTNLTVTTDRLRPNKFAAAALLSRALLYSRDFVESEKYATKVLDNKGYYDTTSVKDVFLKGSKEAIWQLMKPLPNNNVNTHEGKNFILTSRPGTTGFNSSSLSPQLLSAFEPGDRRKVEWIGKITDRTVSPNVDYYFPYKYKVASSALVTEHSIVIRLAELYLIRAECRLQLGKLNGAIEDLDIIRKRAGLPLLKDVNPTISKEDLLDQLLKERQLELFTEWGHRWIDLKRTGELDRVMSAITPLKGGIWNSIQQSFPIPQKEIENNPNLVQNPGYN